MKLRFLLLLSFASSGVALGQSTLTWNTNTAGSNWSVTTNWNPNASPAGNDLVFNDSFGETANATTVGNIANGSFVLNSLTYSNTGTTGSHWQVTQIGSGNTVELNAGTAPATIFTVGTTAASQSTRVAMTGAGTLSVNEATSAMQVGVLSAGSTATLDMSGLSNFNATVSAVNIGTTRGSGDVTLANSNSITANTFTLGDTASSSGSGSKSDLLLGTTNTINADTINVGVRYASGTIGFRTGLTSPLVTIRGTSGGSSRADLTISDTGSTAIGNTQSSSADLTAGEVDGRVDQLLIGRRADNGTTASYAGSFSMAKGTLDSTSVIVGQTAGTGSAANTVTGDVNVSGGSFVAGSISMADNSAGATSVVSNLNVSGTGSVVVAGNVTTGTRNGSATNVAANINISGGSMLVQGNLGEGAGAANVASTITVSGGMLNMDHGNISVDTFTQTGGTLKDVASFSAASSGGLNLQNNSKLAFGIDAGFITLDLTGTLTLGASTDLTLTLANGVTPGSLYTLVGNDGGDSIGGLFATVNGAAFGAGNSFSLTNNMGTFDFTLSYAGGTGNDLIIQAVPEPGAPLTILSGVALLCLVRRARRR